MKKYAITDLGVQADVQFHSETVFTLPRYGVWEVRGGSDSYTLDHVVDTGDDLEALKAQYHTETVIVLTKLTPGEQQQ